MPLRALLLGLALALPALAGEPADPPEFITDDEIDPHLKELMERVEQARKGALRMEQVVQHYQEQAQKKGSPRERAIAGFVYAYVLNSLVGDPKAAYREIQRTLEFAPGFPPACAFGAVLAEESGDRTEAERLLRRALEIDPQYVRAVVQQGQMAARQGDYDGAKELFKRSLEIRITEMALAGLVAVNARLYRDSFDERQREQLAKEALAAVDALITMQPDNAGAWIAKAHLYLDLGRIDDAIRYLEDTYANAGLKPAAQVEILQRLRQVYQAKGDVEGVERTLERLTQAASLTPEQRGRFQRRLEDVRAKGKEAFLEWMVEEYLQEAENDGQSVEARLFALRRLLEFLGSEAVLTEELKHLFPRVFRACVRLLVDAPPELAIEMMRFFRNRHPDPLLARILVHYIYPSGRTPELREETVRTLATCAKLAALPALYYCIQDDSGLVVREVDGQLALLCEVRSPTGGGTEPFSPEQVSAARRAWADFFHSPAGGDRLAKAFSELATIIRPDASERTSAPMIDHAANVLRDNDMPWTAWAAAYEFLVKYWGKDFRPVERRGKPVEAFEREHVVAELEKHLMGN